MKHYEAWLAQVAVEKATVNAQEQIQSVLVQERVVTLGSLLSCSGMD